MSDHQGSKLWPVALAIGGAAMFFGLLVGRTRSPTPAAIPEWVPPFLAVMLLIIVGAVLLMPLIRAWAKRIEGRAADAAVLDEMVQLRERIADLEISTGHMHELEDRLDFAERLLAQRNDAVQLPLHRTPV